MINVQHTKLETEMVKPKRITYAGRVSIVENHMTLECRNTKLWPISFLVHTTMSVP
jgi:hypothetical protein